MQTLNRLETEYQHAVILSLVGGNDKWRVRVRSSSMKKHTKIELFFSETGDKWKLK